MAVYIASAVPSITLSQRNKLLICATAVGRNIVHLTADSRVSTAAIVRNKATSLVSADLGCAPNPRKQRPTARYRTHIKSVLKECQHFHLTSTRYFKSQI